METSAAPAHVTTGRETRDPELVDASSSRVTRHEHCELALLGRAKELLDTRHEPATLSAGAPQKPVESTTASTERSVPLLLLAPKHSPPAIA